MVVDTPVFAQWLVPMAPAIEISQLQFDKVVFVPVVQVCSSILLFNFFQYQEVFGCVCMLN